MKKLFMSVLEKARMDELALLINSVNATEGLTFINIMAGLGAIGFGSIVTTVLTRWFTRDKEKAQTKEILTRTNLSISEIVESKLEQLKKDYESAVERIHVLEREISVLRQQLDTDRQAMYIKALTADVKFYKSRVEILEAQNLALLDSIKENR